jgi:hypothetical protein
MKNPAKKLTTQPNIPLAVMMREYSTEESCKAVLRDLRWPSGVCCPRCAAATKVYALKARPFHWICKNEGCGGRNAYRFSVITKTIFENTNYPLRTWFQVIYWMTQSKKGISALQIHREIRSGDYRTAWYMVRRIRASMMDQDFPKPMGIEEVDGTFPGGKEKNQHRSQRRHQGTAGTGSGKVRGIGAIAWKSSAVCQVIEETTTRTPEGFVRKAVSDRVSLIATDQQLGS